MANNTPVGGKGGPVVLITGVLFIGYLYFTRRLPKVIDAIRSVPGDLVRPGDLPPSSSSGTPVPIAGTIPTSSPYLKLTLHYPANYHIADYDITVPAAACNLSVYGEVLAKTGNAAVAMAMANSVCPEVSLR